ncbi:DMT family transporter [Pseudomonas sp. MH2]|uniref:DMT family transporter n=1 Tax=Pseudomonas machongensis TaxID=3110229 RepID=A0ABU5VHX2_9PSED|nr:MULTISPECIES: DMT family transporter [Pseudomonas]KAB5626394.1 DMT family transporter [Pseudomonas putida]MBH3461624.1 DMT family transporter [Pseudomonas putida]MBK0061391.1 DMT family transporter [Pseudomonas sp. S44]MEA5672080.1 DMT family transporter [Pseudomonas sp. MH2]
MPKVIALSAILPLLIALLAGAAVPFQAGSNAALGRLLGHPLWAAGVSLLVSLMMLVPALLLMRAPMPQLQNLAQAPWWAWLGGVAGVIYITAALVLTPRLGAAGFIVCVIAGQVLSSLLIDQFGLMGLPEKPVNLPRLLGVAMIVGGMLVVQWGTARSA